MARRRLPDEPNSKLAVWSRWIGAMPRDYPDRTTVCDLLAAQGLHGRFEPLWGRTPFHNWLGVFCRGVPA